VLHEAARQADGRVDARPSMVVIDTHLARGASNGGFSFHDRGGTYGHTKGAERVVAVDVTGLPVGALVVPASTHENRTTELMLEHLRRESVTGRSGPHNRSQPERPRGLPPRSVQRQHTKGPRRNGAQACEWRPFGHNAVHER
jgi:hypothetical protein